MQNMADPVCVQYRLSGTVANDASGANPYAVLSDGVKQLTVHGSNAFTFPEGYCPGTRYRVSIVAQSSNSNCVILNGAGVIAASPVNNIRVVCGDPGVATYTFTAGDASSYVYNAGPYDADTILTYGNDEIALSGREQVDISAPNFGAGDFFATVYDAGPGIVRLTMQNPGVPMMLYAGGENNDPIPFLNNTSDTALGSSNVGGYCCGLSGLELGQRNTEMVPTLAGTGYFVFSGAGNGTAPTYASNIVLALGAYDLVMTNGSFLDYAIYPQSAATAVYATNPLSLYATLNVVFSDGTDAISGGATDQHGRSIDPSAQYASLNLDTWNRVFVDLSAFAGKQVDRIDVNFHNDGANGGFRGYIDEINLVGRAANHPTNTSALDPNWTPQYEHIMGYWNFDGAGPIAQDTALEGAGGASLAAQNSDGLGLSYVDGQVGQGVLLDGVDDYFRLPGEFAATSSALTFSAWHYFSGSTNGCQALFNFLYASDEFYGLTEACNGQSSYTAQKSNSDGNTLAVAPLPSNAWNHIVTTFSGNTVTVYVNGLVWGSSDGITYAPADIPGSFRTLGFNLVSGAPAYLRGRLDEVAFWNVALTPGEVQQIYERQRSAVSGTFTSRVFDATVPNASWTGMAWTTPEPFGKALPDGISETTASYPSVAPSLESQLQILWHLEETALGTAPGGTDCLDASGAGNHGIYVGTLGANYRLGQPGILGDSNGALMLDTAGNAGYVVNAAPFPGVPSDFSYQVWFKSSTTLGGRIIGFGDTGTNFSSNYDRHVYMIDSGALIYGVFTGGVTTLQSPTSYNDGRWHHVLVSQQGASGAFYVDGVLIGTVAGTPQSYTPAYLKAGCDNLLYWPLVDHACFFGEVDEVAYWTRALSAAEALQLYRRGANRLGFQVRTCAESDCSDGPSWQGPDGTTATWFSESQNSNGQGPWAASPNMSFPIAGHVGAVSPAEYFQYHAVFDSDDRNSLCTYDATPLGCTAELSEVAIAPTRYSRGAPFFTVISPLPSVSYLTHLTETYGSEGCVGRVGYRLSLDGVHWYYYTAGAWQPATQSAGQLNLSMDLDATILTQFSQSVGTGQLHLQAALRSDGAHPCALAAITLTYLP